MTIKISKIRIPSKKNKYFVAFSKQFDQATSSIRAGMRKYGQKVAWIAPRQEVKDCEKAIAWFARASHREQITGPVRLDIEVAGKGSEKDIEIKITELESGNTSARAGDLDGILTTIMDGLQQWPLKRDSQVCEVHIYRKDDK